MADGVNSIRIDWVAEGNRYPVSYSVDDHNTVTIPNFLRRKLIISVEYSYGGSFEDPNPHTRYETRVYEIRS